MPRGSDLSRWRITGALVVLCAATAVLVFLGERATSGWRRSTHQLVERRTDAVLALLASALSRDMRGAHLSVLVPIDHESLRLDPPYDLADLFGRAFARFPYPESFFAWKDTPAGGVTYVFNRADRPPPWAPGAVTGPRYPVVLLKDPAAVRPLVANAQRVGQFRRPFALFEWERAGVPYHVVVHLLYHSDGRHGLFGLVGFTVNLPWVRRHYFDELIDQVARIGGGEAMMSLNILDDRLVRVASVGPPFSPDSARRSTFPFAFFDPAVMAAQARQRPAPQEWTMEVSAAGDPAASASLWAASGTFLLIGGAAFVMIVGTLLTARAMHVQAQVVALRSEFVFAVTHELKTPLSLICLVAETLAKGRYSTTETIRDYSHLLSEQAARLTRLIDNLLTCSRLHELQVPYSFEMVDVVDLVEDAIEPFRLRLLGEAFEVSVQTPMGLPRVRVDRVAMLQVLENIIDNAIKYSRARRSITIAAARAGGQVHVRIADQGCGIPDDEIGRVFDRFFRGRGNRADGGGLGLAIAHRIVRDHGGDIHIESRAGAGTAVDVALVAEQVVS